MKKLLTMVGVAAVAATLLIGGSASAAVQANDTSATAVVKGSGESKLPRVYKTVEPSAMAGGGTVYFGAHNGCKLLGAGWGLPARHPVAVSATEVDGGGNEFIGAAKITVSNVAAQSNGWVWSWVCIEWNSPIYVNLHYVWG